MPIKLEMPEPNPKQAEFFQAKSRFVAYGGARGGGKSWSVRWKAVLMALRYPGIRVLILRRTFPELNENHILPLRALLMGIAVYKDVDKAFTFPGGSRIKFGYCDREADVLQYQGQEYDVIFLDEATQFTETQFKTLTACLRGANGFPKRFYLTCNPGGVGHAWVKRLFIERDFQKGENPADYTFVQAKVYDNGALMKDDPGYVQMLEGLPEDQRRAWLDGDWNVVAGRYFTEFREDLHVMDPFPIPGWWRRYFTMDYGLDMLAGYWVAVDEAGRAYVYREVSEPDLIISKAAERILQAGSGDRPEAWYAPPDLWNRRQDTGRSVAEIFGDAGIPLVKAQNGRVQGWFDLKEWLKPVRDETGAESARLRIFKNCPELIKSIPALQHSEKDPNDCATQPHEYTHGPDAIRYFVAGRPYPAALPMERDEDAPAQYEEQVNDFLNFGA